MFLACWVPWFVRLIRIVMTFNEPSSGGVITQEEFDREKARLVDI